MPFSPPRPLSLVHDSSSAFVYCLDFLPRLHTSQVAVHYAIMPPSKLKPSEIAAEAKRKWFPYILQDKITDLQTSHAFPDSSAIPVDTAKKVHGRTCVAVMQGDPVAYALAWYRGQKNCRRIPVVNMANEKRAGGDWESGLTSPEECFARRSNLVQALTMPWNAPRGSYGSHYPIPQRGGIYCPEVCEC